MPSWEPASLFMRTRAVDLLSRFTKNVWRLSFDHETSQPSQSPSWPSNTRGTPLSKPTSLILYAMGRSFWNSKQGPSWLHTELTNQLEYSVLEGPESLAGGGASLGERNHR